MSRLRSTWQRTDFAHLIFLFLAIGVIAFLYSSVGHAGASGYIAVMTLFGLSTQPFGPLRWYWTSWLPSSGLFNFGAPDISHGDYFGRSRSFRSGCLLRRLSPVTSSSFENHYRARAAFPRRPIVFSSRRSPGGRSATLARRTRGWFRHRLSLRLTGTGAGIFLTPLLLFSNWAKTKQASAVSAAFILVNSVAGLAGFVSARQSIPALAFILSAAAIVGGAIGSYLGSRKFPVRTVSILLATVLVIAGSKLIFTRWINRNTDFPVCAPAEILAASATAD